MSKAKAGNTNDSDLDAFRNFSYKKRKDKKRAVGTNAVIYTRVSTKEQAENNASLETQKRYCEEFAKRKGLHVVSYFGGTYESAKSDERKEFQRMITYVKKSKSISCIIVYSYDRFSRTGANGAYISQQLSEQGIITLSATQEIDPSSTTGSFQQNLYYLFSQFDNEQRKEKCSAGMREKLKRGEWMGVLPKGYTNLNPGNGKKPEYIINEDGELLKLAFSWRAKGMSYDEIANKLKTKGLSIRSNKLYDIFRNPFYCGVIVSKHLKKGEVVKGIHPPLVSKKLFFQVNEKLKEKKIKGSYNDTDEHLPLKGFVKSAIHGVPYTGYLVRSKGLYYYKTSPKGTKENISAKKMHELFRELLSSLQVAYEISKQPLIDMVHSVFYSMHEDQIKEDHQQQKKVKEINSKIGLLEKRFVFDEISREQYNRFKEKLELEKRHIQEDREKNGLNLIEP